ncbi:Ig-like domain repeat protein [Mumia qirimensis]|uniref:Ig-like domain repeat protein n=1 Tax=Mumia qirimensis TaxID=3234852 RepID=UPI00351D34DD
MISRLTRATAGLTVTALAAATLTLASTSQADPDGDVPLSDAGHVVSWAQNNDDMDPIPTAVTSKAVVSIEGAGQATFAVMADGTVAGWSQSVPRSTLVTGMPAGLSNVVQIAGNGTNVAALKADGTVVAWGATSSLINRVPAGLRDVVDISLGTNIAYALKSDGTITGWGAFWTGPYIPPAGLTDVVDVSSSQRAAFALKADGTIVGWGDPLGLPSPLDVPDSIQGHVERILFTGGSHNAVRTDDGRMHTWPLGAFGYGAAGIELPEGLVEDSIVDASSTGANFIAVAESGHVYLWGQAGPPLDNLLVAPAALDGKSPAAAASSSVGHTVLYRALTPVRAPRISGSSLLGSTLTVTPATFSGTPESTTTQWLADGAPIPGATNATLSLTTTLLGKRISIEQTATQGSETAKATSTATAPVARPQVASSLRASAGTVRYGTTTPRVSVTLSPSNATGRVDLYKGTRRLSSGNSIAGRATLTLAKTTLAPGTHTLTVRYAGNTTTKPSATTVRVGVAKANAAIAAKAKTKKIVAKKTKAKIAVTVRATGVRAGGTVAVYQGKKKIGTARLKSNGTAVVTLKKLKKAGKTKLTIRYLGSSTINKATKTIKVKIRKR